jgi:hypothetical protein
MLRTGQLHPSRFAPGLSTTHGDITTEDLGVSPDRTHTGRLPSACRSVTSQQPPRCHGARTAGRTPRSPGIGRFSGVSTVRVAESLQGERDRIALVGRDVDLDQLASAGGASDEAHRPAGHRDCLRHRTERSVRCPAGISGLDDPNYERAAVFSTNTSL